LDDAAAVPLASRSGSLSSGPASLVSASLLSSTITVSLIPEEKKTEIFYEQNHNRCWRATSRIEKRRAWLHWQRTFCDRLVAGLLLEALLVMTLRQDVHMEIST
jgi:hypothetical protein